MRITEQDVVNEEMYEEEDDDQHGRLDARRKAICKTGSTYTSPKFTKTDVSLLVFCSFLLAKQDEIQMLEDCSDQIDVRYNFFNKCALLEDLETKILDDGKFGFLLCLIFGVVFASPGWRFETIRFDVKIPPSDKVSHTSLSSTFIRIMQALNRELEVLAFLSRRIATLRTVAHDE